MVTSVTFPKKGKGYIWEKLQKPYEPSKTDYRRYGDWRYTKEEADEEKQRLHLSHYLSTPFNQERYDRDMARYKEEFAYWKEHKDEYILPCHHLLIGKTFEFSTEKINVIFGPNGCGKTTIIKAIAGEGYCPSGLNKLPDQFSRGFDIFDDKTPRSEQLDRVIAELKINTSKVEWSGNPIYYDNFADVEVHSGMNAGGLMGMNIFGGVGDELLYMVGRNKISAGQRATYLFNRLVDVLAQKHSLRGILESQLDPRKQYSFEIGQAAIERFSKRPDFDKECPTTVLFDELDKSLDIETVCKLYKEILPSFQQEFGVQIILVSHSPIFVMSGMRNDERYHIIDMDEEYSKECITNIKALNQ